jgi:phage I-like protein
MPVRHLNFRTASLRLDLYGNEIRQAPTELCLFKAGINKSEKGEFIFDDESARLVMEKYLERGRELVIDYEHQSIQQPPQKALAAGWFKLEVRNGELYAVDIRWTDQAKAEIEAAQYRYWSPYFRYDERTGRVVDVMNNALTNNPALYGLPAMVAASTNAREEDTDMDPELKKALERAADLEKQNQALEGRLRSLEGQSQTAALSLAVGLPQTASGDELRTRVVALSNFRSQVLAIAGKDNEAAAIGALTAIKEQAAEGEQLRKRAEVAAAEALSSGFKTYLDNLSTAGEGGKFLPPARRQKAEAMALSLGGGKLTEEGVTAAKEYIAEMLVDGKADPAKPIPSAGGGAGGAGGGGSDSLRPAALTATGRKLAQDLGRDPAKVEEFIKAEHAAGRLI